MWCPRKPPTVQVIEWMLLDVVTSAEDIVLVEDTSDDNEIVSQVTVEDPNDFLIAIEDIVTLSMTKVKAKVPKLMEDPLIKATSYLSTIAWKEKDIWHVLLYIPLHRLP